MFCYSTTNRDKARKPFLLTSSAMRFPVLCTVMRLSDLHSAIGPRERLREHPAQRERCAASSDRLAIKGAPRIMSLCLSYPK